MAEHCGNIYHIQYIDCTKNHGNPENEFKIIVQDINDGQRENHDKHKVILRTKHCKPVYQHIPCHRDVFECRAVLSVKINGITCNHRRDD